MRRRGRGRIMGCWWQMMGRGWTCWGPRAQGLPRWVRGCEPDVVPPAAVFSPHVPAAHPRLLSPPPVPDFFPASFRASFPPRVPASFPASSSATPPPVPASFPPPVPISSPPPPPFPPPRALQHSSPTCSTSTPSSLPWWPERASYSCPTLLSVSAACQHKINIRRDTDISLEKPDSALNESSMTASSPLFTQSSLTIIHIVIRFLMLA